jgi:LysM repeat protein
MVRNSVTTRVIALLSVLMLGLTGCFRQADEAFVAVTVTSNPVIDSAQASPTDQGGAPVAVTLTPSLPADTGPTSTLPVIFQITSSPTPEGFSPLAATQTIEAQPSLTATTSQNFITPGSPLQDLLVLTNTPTLDPAASTQQAESTAVIAATSLALTPVNPDCIYVVQRGDSLYQIALRNDTSVEAIKLTNNMTTDIIRPGDELVIPECETTGSGATAEPSATATAQPDGTQLYVVRSGDSLSVIASRFGVTVRAIMDANGLTDPDRLSLGQELIIPVPATTP